MSHYFTDFDNYHIQNQIGQQYIDHSSTYYPTYGAAGYLKEEISNLTSPISPTDRFLQNNVVERKPSGMKRLHSDPGPRVLRPQSSGVARSSKSLPRVSANNVVEFTRTHRRAISAASSRTNLATDNPDQKVISPLRTAYMTQDPAKNTEKGVDENGNLIENSGSMPSASTGPGDLGLSQLEISHGDFKESDADCSIAGSGKRIIRSHRLSQVLEASDSDDDLYDTHPNKFPVAIEEHKRRECGYYRQRFRSGNQVKIVKRREGDVVYNPVGEAVSEVQPEMQKKFYRKDLVRICVCGLEVDMEQMLHNRGRDNDTDGYEIHYNTKCRWKAYEDFKTKKRVLIRLCKCYKPSF